MEFHTIRWKEKTIWVSVNGKRTFRGQQFVLIPKRSIKELTRASNFPSSWQFSKTIRFGDANRRGSPSRIEGLGSSIERVKGKGSPCRFVLFIIKKSVRLSSPKDYCLLFFIMSLQNFFRLVCFFRQADRQKAKQWFSTWISKYTSRIA